MLGRWAGTNKVMCLQYIKPYPRKLATDPFPAVASGTIIFVKKEMNLFSQHTQSTLLLQLKFKHKNQLHPYSKVRPNR